MLGCRYCEDLRACPALVAPAPEDDLGAVDGEALGGPPGHGEAGEVGGQVAHLAARAADEVVVRRLDVGVEAGRAGADVEHRDGAELGQVVEGLVDGLERDVGHLAADLLVDPLGRGVRHVALEGAEDALALGRDLAAVRPEQVGQCLG